MLAATTAAKPPVAKPTLVTEEETTPWYALRLFERNYQRLTAYFDQHQMTWFMPMRYREQLDADGKLRRVLTPVVSNLVFVKKTLPQADMQQLLDGSFFKLQVVRKEQGSPLYCEIPAREMRELIYICDPDKILYELISVEEAAMRPGTDVVVTHGPMKGYHGKLVRKSHQYFLVRLYTSLAVMVKVTRWCCKPLT